MPPEHAWIYDVNCNVGFAVCRTISQYS